MYIRCLSPRPVHVQQQHRKWFSAKFSSPPVHTYVGEHLVHPEAHTPVEIHMCKRVHRLSRDHSHTIPHSQSHTRRGRFFARRRRRRRLELLHDLADKGDAGLGPGAVWIVAALRPLASRPRQAIKIAEGCVDSAAGDGLLALLGAPRARHVGRLLRCSTLNRII